MKLSVAAGALSGILIAWACTPISPSVHKSTLRPGVGAQILPKQEDSAEAPPIEARWIDSEEELNSALDVHSSALVIRLSSESLDKLKADGVLLVELPTEARQKSIDRARILLRVQMESESLERALAEEAWSFSWDSLHPNTIEIRSSAVKKTGESIGLPEALISVHVVLQHEASP